MSTPRTVYRSSVSELVCGDAFDVLSKMEAGSVDVIFADPPYFLSDGGISCKNGKMVSVDKGDWDKPISAESMHLFNRKWIALCYEVLKPDGAIWITGTFHNIYSIGVALEQEGYEIINNITWQKPNPPPNLACKCFTHSTETVIWAKKKKRDTLIYRCREFKRRKALSDKGTRLVWVLFYMQSYILSEKKQKGGVYSGCI